MPARTSTVLSIAAVLIAVFGTTGLAEAAWNQIVPRGSVGTLQLKRNAVTSSKIAPNAIRTGQVVDGSLLTADFRAGQIPQGPKGDRGERGPAGPPGISGYEVVRANPVTVSAGGTLSSIAITCPTGKKVLGGTQGVQVGLTSSAGVFFVTSVSGSVSGGTNNVYRVAPTNTNTTPRTIVASAICARVTE